MSTQPPLYASTVMKYAMGRSLGIHVKNWKMRHLVIFPDAIAYYESEDAFNKKQKAKFEAGIKNYSLCIINATEKDHPEAKEPLLFILRVWDGGVFDILVKPKDPTEKAKFLSAIREATANVKGFQMVGDADVLGGEDADHSGKAADDEDDALGSPPADTPKAPPKKAGKKKMPPPKAKAATPPSPAAAEVEIDRLEDDI